MIWIKLWNTIESLTKGTWLIIQSPYTSDETEILKEELEYE